MSTPLAVPARNRLSWLHFAVPVLAWMLWYLASGFAELSRRSLDQSRRIAGLESAIVETLRAHLQLGHDVGLLRREVKWIGDRSSRSPQLGVPQTFFATQKPNAQSAQSPTQTKLLQQQP